MRTAFLAFLFLLVFFWTVPVLAGSGTDIAVNATPNWTASLPIVTSSSATEVTSTSAVLHGNITLVGGYNLSLRGFEWGLSTGIYNWTWNETGSFGLGSFSHQLLALNLSTQYFWRAYAENEIGINYSGELSFWTLNLPLPPTNFTIERIGTNSINASWIMGPGAASTYIRVDKSGYPSNVTEGYFAYNGTDTWVVIEGLELDTSQYFYSAWSENSYGFSEDYAEAKTGGETVIVIAFIAIALFFMWLSLRTRQLLICVVTSLIWLALSLWIFFSNVGFFDLSDGYVKILAYVFFGVAFIPIVWSMNQEIKHEAQGKSWTTYGTPPSEKGPSSSEKYRAELKRRVRGGQ